MWNKQFISAEIKKKNDTCYVLTINYCWYFMINFSETFVEETLEACKTRLLTERSQDHIKYYNEVGIETPKL